MYFKLESVKLFINYKELVFIYTDVLTKDEIDNDKKVLTDQQKKKENLRIMKNEQFF